MMFKGINNNFNSNLTYVVNVYVIKIKIQHFYTRTVESFIV